jgi:hypothetical protein
MFLDYVAENALSFLMVPADSDAPNKSLIDV